MAIVNISNATKTAFVNALNLALGNSATMSFYTGTMPSGPDSAPGGGNTVIATVTFEASGNFGIVSGPVLSAAGLPIQASAVASGTVTWARLSTSANVAVVDVDVGTSNTTVIVANATVSQGNFIQCSSVTFQAN
jgi:hypothetical protein